MQSRGLDRPAAVRVIVEGFFEPLDRPARRPAARAGDPRADRRQARRRRRRHRALRARRGDGDDRQRARSLEVRADFPILAREIDGRRLVYLDSASTSQKPAAVLDALDDYYRNHNANIHRGVYTLAQEADALFEGARARIAAFVHWPAAGTIFTRNVTEAINLVAYSWARTTLRAGDAILITEMEHHSNIVPWQLAAAGDRRAAALPRRSTSTARSRSTSSTPSSRAATSRSSRVTHVSNVLGTINPVAEIVAPRPRRRRAGPRSTAPRRSRRCRSTSPRSTPTSTAGPATRRSARPASACCTRASSCSRQMPPFLSGGDMIATVEAQRSTWNELPWKFEAGTSMIAQAIGLGAAIDYLAALGMDNVRAHERALTAYALERLRGDRGRDACSGRPAPHERGGVVVVRARRASTPTTSASCSAAAASACARATTARSR